MTESWKFTLSEGLRRMAEGTLSAAEWVGAILSRIGQCEDRLKAWAQVDREGALEAARAADRSRAEGRPLGPLAGAPFGAKDIFDIKGLRREAGTPLYRGHVPDADAVSIARLRAAGAVAIGKTVTTPFANSDPSVTRNPWDLARSPGGSSSGSAAAVAAGMVPVALGSQTTGSTLRPAAFCGVCALKPTYGRIPRTGIVKVSWTFDHVGLIARSVEDLAHLLTVMSGPAPGDDGAPDIPAQDFAAASAPRRPGRALLLKEDYLPLANAEVADWTLRAVSLLREKGVKVEEGRLPMDRELIHSVHAMIRAVDAACYHGEMFRENMDAYPPSTRRTVTAGFMVPAVHYVNAMRLRSRFIRAVDRLHGHYELIVLPTFDQLSPPWEVSTGSGLFCEPFSLSGQPAVTLPLGRGGEGLPFGIQLGARRFGEAGLLAAARWCEEELGWRAGIAEPGGQA
ncbi:MAG: amidase [Candidatus Tectomicrobia bacterium]|uniref:Amidase n=1 Tax=Tectimicrobiota bacterium TaxID=2528274 RepID=A0A932HWS1_UNCTE|nr:amidase [Candidatus Tectomicrobia bacterium]